MSTSAEIVNGALVIASGKQGKDARIVKLRIPCDIDNAAHFGVPLDLFSNREGSISTILPNILRLDVQLDFKLDDTAARTVDVRQFGDWIGAMVKKVRGLKFSFPCEVYVAVTDVTHLYQDSNDDLVALGEEEDKCDDPSVVIMGNRGRLVQVGQTGY